MAWVKKKKSHNAQNKTHYQARTASLLGVSDASQTRAQPSPKMVQLMKYMLTLFLFILIAINMACRKEAEGSNTKQYALYKSYTVYVPEDNYIILNMRGLTPDNYLVISINDESLRIYSPYESAGLLVTRKLTTEELGVIVKIFQSKEYTSLPQTNNTVALDAEEITIDSIINTRKRHIHHVMPENVFMRRITNLYKELNRIDDK